MPVSTFVSPVLLLRASCSWPFWNFRPVLMSACISGGHGSPTVLLLIDVGHYPLGFLLSRYGVSVSISSMVIIPLLATFHCKQQTSLFSLALLTLYIISTPRFPYGGYRPHSPAFFRFPSVFRRSTCVYSTLFFFSVNIYVAFRNN